MTADENRLIEICRAAGQKNDWGTVYGCARELVSRHPSNPEGFFFLGMAEKAAQRTAASVDAFEKCLQLDGNRFDAGMELASQYAKSFRNDEALALLQRYSNSISQSPWYLDMAGTIYTGMGKAAAATPMFERAASLQSDALFFQSHLAANYVFVGKIDAAKDIYRSLLATNPNHQRNHYSLSRLDRAVNRDHVNQMKAVLQRENKPESQNVFLYYALGKELEDLESWDEAMDFYLKGARAVKSVLSYRVTDDEALIQQIIDSCSTDWYRQKIRSVNGGGYHKKPIFLVGLPRTGTTLAERVLSGHSKIESIGETHYFEMVMKTTSGLAPSAKMTLQVILSAIDADAGGLGQRYLDRVRYLWGDKELFIEKLPKNHLYLGFIAAAFPDAPIVWLRRNPMDACLAMFKQLFTGVYEFTYDFDDLARYYRMYDRLYAHWKAVLGDRIIEIEYENLVSDLPGATANVLARMGLGYEQACIEFDENTAPSTTASAVQVREKVHSKSVLKWKNFARHLEPLRSRLEADGIVT